MSPSPEIALADKIQEELAGWDSQGHYRGRLYKLLREAEALLRSRAQQDDDERYRMRTS